MKLTYLLFSVVVLLRAGLAHAELKFESQDKTVTAGLSDTAAHLEFSFKNVSDKPISVGKITTSCGCTTAGADHQVYLPGQVGAVHVDIDIGSAAGHLVKTIIVEMYEAGATSSAELRACVEIPPIATFEPTQYVQWAQGEPAVPKTVRVNIVAPFSMRIIGVKSWHQDIEASLKEIVPGKTYYVVLTPLNTNEIINTAVELLPDATWPGQQKKIWVLVHVKQQSAG